MFFSLKVDGRPGSKLLPQFGVPLVQSGKFFLDLWDLDGGCFLLRHRPVNTVYKFCRGVMRNLSFRRHPPTSYNAEDFRSQAIRITKSSLV